MQIQRYIAMFSNGEVATRQTHNRVYTHAYLVHAHYVRDRQVYEYRHSGFSKSEAQARKNMAHETAWMRRRCVGAVFAEVVAVIAEVTERKRKPDVITIEAS